MKAFILPVGIILFLVALGAVLWVYGPQPGRERTSLDGITASPVASLDLGGPFTLTDQHGKIRKDEEFRGRFMLVYFGYTFCPDICPTDMLAMSQVLERLGKDGEKVAAMFITVDPERDTAEHLASVMSNFHPDMLALTGSLEQVEAAKQAYKVYSAKATPEGTSADYLVDHSTFIYLMGPDGRYITHFNHGTPAETILERVNRELAKQIKAGSIGRKSSN
ncbi:SCO family protein [bacterium]|nr:SCO family protein [bacterium]